MPGDPLPPRRFGLITEAGDTLEIEQRGAGVTLWAHGRPVAHLTPPEARSYGVKVLIAAHEAREAAEAEAEE